mmetsp:Transcript_130561/g.279113  ORF Transcript_130561/g.279113 Transcript_130561/m.279113 type:complete len:209 (-) Transcript_130561:999-1625(-)
MGRRCRRCSSGLAHALLPRLWWGRCAAQYRLRQRLLPGAHGQRHGAARDLTAPWLCDCRGCYRDAGCSGDDRDIGGLSPAGRRWSPCGHRRRRRCKRRFSGGRGWTGPSSSCYKHWARWSIGRARMRHQEARRRSHGVCSGNGDGRTTVGAAAIGTWGVEAATPADRLAASHTMQGGHVPPRAEHRRKLRGSQARRIPQRHRRRGPHP